MKWNKKIGKNDIIRYRGYKFYREREDGTFEVIRFTGNINQIDDDFDLSAQDDDTGELFTIFYSELKENYTPISPEGIVSFNIVNMDESNNPTKDVLILMYKAIEVAIGIKEPFAVCRQSINDFFSTFVVKDPVNNELAGVCCSRDNCPTNIDYNYLMSCSSVQRSDIVNYYKDDTMDTLLDCIPVDKYDKVLNKLYEEHAKVAKDPIAAAASGVYDGWCRELHDLMETNNCMTDFNLMNNIIGVDFDMDPHITSHQDPDTLLEMDSLDKIATLFLSEVVKCRIISTRVTEYNYSIDLSKFNNTNYTLIRDKNNKVFVVVYLASGEFLEEELEAEINKLDVTDKLRLAYYNKYQK